MPAVFQLFLVVLTLALAVSGAAAPWLTLSYCVPIVLGRGGCVTQLFYLNLTSYSTTAGAAFLLIGFLLCTAVRVGEHSPVVPAPFCFQPLTPSPPTPCGQDLAILAGKFFNAAIMSGPTIPTARSWIVCVALASLCLGTVIAGAPGGINMVQAVTVPGASAGAGYGCAVSACVFQAITVGLNFKNPCAAPEKDLTEASSSV